jgi:protein-disulfide isomerase
MRIRLTTLLVLAALVACGGEDAPPASSTSDASRGLLSSVRPDAQGEQKVPARETEAGRNDGPVVDVRLLGYDMGDTAAVVRVVEMSDYGCGYCRRFHEETWPAIQEQFIATGKVHWKFLPFVTGMFEHSLVASEAGECALAQGDDAFQAMSPRIWEEQPAWKNASDPQAVLHDVADEAGLDATAWDACMDGHQRVERVRQATSLAQKIGVRGTPTFFVEGYPPLQGALPKETFTRILQMIYAQTLTERGAAGGEQGGTGAEEGA